MSTVDHYEDLMEQYAREEDWERIREIFSDLHPADIAELVGKVSEDQLPQVFRLVDPEKQPLVLVEMEERLNWNILEALDNRRISEMLESMHPDDAADILLKFPEAQSRQILSMMEEEESEDVRELMQYDEETAGGIMTTDFVSLPEHLTVEEALNRIAQLNQDEPFYYTYVVDNKDVMIGLIALWEMIKVRNKNMRLSDLVERDFVAATVDMDQEECANLMSKYDLSSLPVLDSDGSLAGRIMVDDVIDVITDEASEDLFLFAGSDDEELEYSSSLRSARIRLPWLMITLFAGFVSSILLRKFIELPEIMALSFFVPIIMGMGGNTGIQSSTLVIRRLAIGTLDIGDLSTILRKELTTGLIMGVLCGLAIGVWARFMFAWGDNPASLSPLVLASISGIALCAAMAFAALYGAFTPMVLKSMKIDPAIASGPFVTASNDIIALLIYYSISLGFVALYA